MILAHELLTPDEPPDRWMLFLHGILGRGANWRSLARKWLGRRPGWGAALVDLRDHGDSQGLAGPPTIQAAARDLVPLAKSLQREHGGRVAGVLGHSFGGKVAIAGAQSLRTAGLALDELWIIDAPPGPRPLSTDAMTDRVLATLAELPARFEQRRAFVDAVVAAGIAEPIAQWLATNLIEGADGYRFGLDLDRITALLDSFAAADMWLAIEHEIAAGARVTLVLGERSDAVPEADVARAERLDGLALATVADAGHWVHVDNPGGLLEILART